MADKNGNALDVDDNRVDVKEAAMMTLDGKYF
jgi:hypothetical protein